MDSDVESDVLLRTFLRSNDFFAGSERRCLGYSELDGHSKATQLSIPYSLWRVFSARSPYSPSRSRARISKHLVDTPVQMLRLREKRDV